jgi:two-component system cell cycle sensor histidine kinase/response regulator CckA
MSPNGAITILLVDDEPVVSWFAARVLGRHGYAVILAKDGLEGLHFFHERRDQIDMVITDVRMPGMTGPEMVEAMRRDRPHICVLFLSGHDDSMPRWVDETCGLLAKPFGAAPFIAAVENCLRNTCKLDKAQQQ